MTVRCNCLLGDGPRVRAKLRDISVRPQQRVCEPSVVPYKRTDETRVALKLGHKTSCKVPRPCRIVLRYAAARERPDAPNSYGCDRLSNVRSAPGNRRAAFPCVLKGANQRGFDSDR